MNCSVRTPLRPFLLPAAALLAAFRPLAARADLAAPPNDYTGFLFRGRHYFSVLPEEGFGKLVERHPGLPGWLFLLIAWRSWAGLQAGMRTAGGGAVLLFAGAAVTLAGKAAGGYLGERFGRGRVTAASVGGSALLAFACDPAWTGAWLALLFVAQLATGPVLSMVYDRTGGRGGAAFGLNCLGLFAGSLL